MIVRHTLQICVILLSCFLFVATSFADKVTEERIRSEVIAPYSLGIETDMKGVWELLNGSGAKGGYVIESEWLKPLPGFSGAAINLIIMLDLEGVLIDVKILNHNEPIFVSGLGQAPFHAFIEQYRGHSINSAITIGSSYGKNNTSGGLIYFDGVTKATASVRIAHESIMASAREVAKNLLDGMSMVQEKVTLKPDEGIEYTWDELVEKGFAKHVTTTHLIDLKRGVPDDGTAMVIRIDRRQGFSPVREWDITLAATRERGILQPEIGQVALNWKYQADKQFFDIEKAVEPPTPFEAAVFSRMTDLIILAVLLSLICLVVLFNRQFVRMKSWPYQRGFLLMLVLGFIGWWGQGQLSIVTPLATMVSAVNGRPLDFLLYDPFSLLIWVVVIISFFVVGRALFCGWLCPFGAMQEFVAKIAKVLSIPQLKVTDAWDSRLKSLKYVTLLVLIGVAFFLPSYLDKAVEVEPFKTAISVFFVREWYFAAYALLCVIASLFIFKAYCRYLCPLGAFMAIGGFLRLSKWIKRREDCGSPCQLCKVRCDYQAIKPSGKITYSECFGCLDCVDIYEDKTQCVPLILQEKGRRPRSKQAINAAQPLHFKPQ